MPSPGGRAPPKETHPLPPKNPAKPNPKPRAISSAAQMQLNLTNSGSLTTNTTNTEPTTTKNTTQMQTMSAPMPTAQKYTKAPAAKSTPGANPHYTPRSSATLCEHPTPTHSATRVAPNDTSPGVHSSRQSNDINECTETFDAENSEGHMTEAEADDSLVPGKHIFQQIFPTLHICICY